MPHYNTLKNDENILVPECMIIHLMPVLLLEIDISNIACPSNLEHSKHSYSNIFILW